LTKENETPGKKQRQGIMNVGWGLGVEKEAAAERAAVTVLKVHPSRTTGRQKEPSEKKKLRSGKGNEGMGSKGGEWLRELAVAPPPARCDI
jgi:hypothetical protein